jgi:general secretion pathway protein D
VQFPQGASISYHERTSTVVIRNTLENISEFEKVLQAITQPPFQVEIEAKFIEISQADLDELSFDWEVGGVRVGGGGIEGGRPSTPFGITPNLQPLNNDLITSGLRDNTAIQASAIDALLAGNGTSVGDALPGHVATIRGIMTNPQFQLVIKAISQKKSTDFLSAPKITTLSGVQAQIRVVQEFIYPTEFSQPQVGNGGISTSIPSAFKTREVGVLLNVTPNVANDLYTINMTLIPEVSEFLGFIDYSPDATQSVNTNAANTQVSTSYNIKQPLFSTRSLTTSIVVYDGQTVVLGGLMRDDLQKINDKVPFLGDLPWVGRLFRSEVTTRSKRNLLIFVSARLIDAAGNPYRR